jgi:very-short-patch-repair endonuclease
MPRMTGKDKILRKNQTDTEAVFWARLRTAKLNLKFRRHERIGKYCVDFVSFSKKLIIEIDGGQHNDMATKAKDEQRTAWLISQGFRVIRFWDNEVRQNPEGVLQMIQDTLAELSPSPDLSHRRRGINGTA